MHMLIVRAFAQEMIIVGINLHLELFAGLDERIDELERMLRMHIIIRETVNDEQIAF